MSVILFDVKSVYQEMASAYEALKYTLKQTTDDRARFYRALRRMYYANVATYLCQYHDNTPLGENELKAISTVQSIPASIVLDKKTEYAEMYINAWSSLKYNTITNDGEIYKAEESYQLLQSLSESITLEALNL